MEFKYFVKTNYMVHCLYTIATILFCDVMAESSIGKVSRKMLLFAVFVDFYTE